MIVNNRREMRPDAGQDELDQLRLRYRLAAQAADSYAQAGFTVVVQDVVIGKMLNDFVSFVQSRPFYVVVLCPSTDAVKEREASRSKKGYGDWTVETLDHVLRSETWQDTSNQTPEQSADEILARMKDEALVF
jgi:chloramphenicol 3-O-phosphotransferase